MKSIRIAAALILRDNGDTLLVRKRGTSAFMQPGGKIEAGETAAAALIRELNEEIGLRFTATQLSPFGRFEAEAANEPDHRVIAEVFRLDIGDDVIQPAAEIEEIRWISPANLGDIPLASLTEHQILPAHRQQLSAGMDQSHFPDAFASTKTGSAR
ncbi:NUDIX domain-containing protein [Rhizobium leucaenae]|uniref:Mutator protein MutT n=1 Tax=Rhizobium leucaenae TaxID=29450 RepID=A0A7W6ZQ68_9HYPH|nr:mutator protein MutT [Rhizobium leucaenae]MBB6301411.1 mutator protein MutT [Rhizobium leucaenae]